ncbi:MAG: histidinol-phosphatase [Spirochaetales bacterium]
MHTPLCGHAQGEPREYVDAAKRVGVDLITFTCHIPMDDPSFGTRGTRMAESDLPRYREMVADAAAYGKELGVEVRFGIEAEVFPDDSIMKRMDRTLERWDFDFVLGSLHHQLSSYQNRIRTEGLANDEAIIKDYFAVLAREVASRRYDSIAHPDLIRIYGTVSPFDPREYEREIRAFYESAAKHDVCLEVNTSGMIKGVYEMHPDPRTMQWAREAGCRFTLGSDSHRPESVGQYFDRALENLSSAGYREISFFRNRRREDLSIEDTVAV